MMFVPGVSLLQKALLLAIAGFGTVFVVAMETVAIAEPASASPWTPAMVTALFGGIATIIAAIGVLFAQVYASRKAGDKKLDNITTLVDGNTSRLLRKIAYLLRVQAEKSGSAADRKVAEQAEREADEQEARVAAAIDKGEEPR